MLLHEAPTLLPCFYKQIFGISCPLCGFQRSVWFLIHGDVVMSIRMFPLLFPCLIAFGLLLYAWWKHRGKLLKWSTVTLLSMLAVNMIYQNIWNY